MNVPAKGAGGKCSTDPTKKASFRTTIESPGIKGVYLLPKPDYDRLVNASQSTEEQTVQFQYFIQYSCTGGSVTACQKNTGDAELPNNVTCLAFVNEGNKSLTATFNLDFNSSEPLLESSAQGTFSNTIMITAITGGICTLSVNL